MTLNEAAYNVLNIARGGLSSDDDRLSIRQIKAWIRYYRSYMIVINTKNGKEIDPQLLQDLGVLTLTEVDKADSTIIDWGCNIKKVKIPKLVDLPNMRGLYYVGLINKQCPFIITNPNVVGFKKHARFTGDMRRAYMIGEWLYVTDPFDEDIKYINVRGIFDDPQAVEYTDQDGNESCIDDDDQYPMPESYMPDIVEMILRKELNVITRSVNDENNDAREPNAGIDDQTQLHGQ